MGSYGMFKVRVMPLRLRDELDLEVRVLISSEANDLSLRSKKEKNYYMAKKRVVLTTRQWLRHRVVRSTDASSRQRLKMLCDL
jgi:hypothetical protein